MLCAAYLGKIREHYSVKNPTMTEEKTIECMTYFLKRVLVILKDKKSFVHTDPEEQSLLFYYSMELISDNMFIATGIKRLELEENLKYYLLNDQAIEKLLQ